MSTHPHRVPAGVRTGGQFTATLHSEPAISLRAAPTLLTAGQARAVTNSRIADGVAHLGLTDEQTDELRRWIDLTGDFSYRTVRARAEEIYMRDNGYSPVEYRAHLASGGAPESPFDRDAVRRDIEQMRKQLAEAS